MVGIPERVIAFGTPYGGCYTSLKIALFAWYWEKRGRGDEGTSGSDDATAAARC